MARQRPARLRVRGRASRFLNPARDGAVLPVLHLNEPRSLGPPCWAASAGEEVRDLLRGHGYDAARRLWRGPPRDAPAVLGRRSPTVGPASGASRRDARNGGGDGRAPAVADDRAAHPERLDRAPRGRRRADRGHVPRPPGARCPAVATNPEHLAHAGVMDALLPARGTLRCDRSAIADCAQLAIPQGEPADERLARTPTAAG